MAASASDPRALRLVHIRPAHLWWFTKVGRPQLRAEGVNFVQHGKRAQELWETMPVEEKRLYFRLSLLDHQRYAKQMVELLQHGDFTPHNDEDIIKAGLGVADISKALSVLINKLPYEGVKAKGTEDESACVICFEYKADRKFAPCDHQIVCGSCLAKGELDRCPFCRADVKAVYCVKP